MNFFQRVVAFNKMYGLPTPAKPLGGVPNHVLVERLTAFKRIITEEITEVDDIILKLRWGDLEDLGDIMAELADWLGDIQVYAASEMVRHGLPPEPTLNIIMDSNDSKLGADGKPIIADGKVQKGPNYWKPERKIRNMLEQL